MPGCKLCGASIYWDSSRRTESGKWIPIDKETGESHENADIFVIALCHLIVATN